MSKNALAKRLTERLTQTATYIDLLMILEAYIINPAKTKAKTQCSSCDIEYSKKEYSVLYKSKKIIYFTFLLRKKKIILCHECLYALVRQIKLKEKEAKLVLIGDKGQKYICNFD